MVTARLKSNDLETCPVHVWAIGCITTVAPGCPYWQSEKIFDYRGVIIITGAVPGSVFGNWGRGEANSIPLRNMNILIN